MAGKTIPGLQWPRRQIEHVDTDLLREMLKTVKDRVNYRNGYRQRRVVDQLEKRFPEVANLLEEGAHDILAFSAFPKAHWRQIWSNNPQERFNREIRRRTDVVSIFPNRSAIIRLVGDAVAGENGEWCCSKRYMSLDTLNNVHGSHNHYLDEVRKLAA